MGGTQGVGLTIGSRKEDEQERSKNKEAQQKDGGDQRPYDQHRASA